MTDMIERVARAMWLARGIAEGKFAGPGIPQDWIAAYALNQPLIEAEARAACDAMLTHLTVKEINGTATLKELAIIDEIDAALEPKG